MYHENYHLAYKSKELKNAGKIHSTWFWNNAVNIKLDERSQSVNIFTLLTSKNVLVLLIWMNS